MKEETINRKNITEYLLEYQLEMIDKTLIDVIDNDNWRFDFTLTLNQNIQFKSYAIPLIRKIFKANKLKGENIFQEFIKLYGLRIKN